MSDEKKSSFEGIEAGPTPSDSTEDASAPAAAVEEHPSVTALQAHFGDAVLSHQLSAGDQHIVFVPPSRNTEILGWLRDDPEQQYDLLRDVTAVDYGGDRPLQVVYQLFSIPHGTALRVKCELPVTELEIESAAGLWNSANWLEREVYDLFGITFLNHPDLRRIMMPEDYAEGHPLRKDFPLRGRFSRAEQTRRALSQELEHYYPPAMIEEAREEGREPQVLPPFQAEVVEEEVNVEGEGDAS